ncbi:response regulator [Microscilla marina]|uniref:Sensory transduction regulatory protein n=1 Tax=Microscilla marina ATCC 23134 TaxID=313606 RepID=A1ZE99_MICM2|nr:response regulator [Microscilla marina]EAY31407.1 sensory transduction regulatory protein [Microscilla marina ATCC 23134]
MNTGTDILLVEDSINDAELTIRALKRKNVCNKIHHVLDGEEALDFIFSRGTYIDQPFPASLKLILLDIKLPKIDGLEVLKVLKAHEKTKLIPVVMLTSSNQEPDIAESYKSGANSYIVKPVAFDKFVEAVVDVGMYWVIRNQPTQ